MKLHYFDHNATAPLSKEAKAAWLEATEACWLNPSSPYRSAAAVKVRYEAVRESLAERLRVEPGRVLFTSGATEGNNAVMRHWAGTLSSDKKVGVSPIEHPSVIEAAKHFLGERIEWLPMTQDGRVDMDEFVPQIRSGALAAISVMAANNETGVIQPWQVIAELCAEAAIPYHCDASQWVGRMSLSDLGDCSYVTACAHKFGGPRGVGFMLLPSSGDRCHLFLGGSQEAGHRAGTEDVVGVLSMAAALKHSTQIGESGPRDTFIEKITRMIPEIRVVGVEAPRLWNTVSLIMPKHQSVRWIRLLEKAGFLLSAGSACSTGKSALSHVLLKMGIDEGAAGRVLRISAGAETTGEDWRALADAIPRTYEALNDEADSTSSTVISID